MIYLTHMSEKEILDHANIIDEIIANSPFSEERKESLETAHQALKEIASIRHNGYSNYPTWLLASYIDNTEHLYTFFNNLAASIEKENKDPLTKNSIMIQSLKEFVESKIPYIKNDFYIDLLNASIEMIDFPEIAKTYFE